jgi:sulfide:quinone oxidoreductase
VVLVDREPRFALAASFLWIMNGTRTPEQISRPLARLARKGIEVLHGEVERIDAGRAQAVVNGRRLYADHMIVALGAEFRPDAVPGLAQWGYTF